MLDWRIGTAKRDSALNFLWKDCAEEALHFWFLFAVHRIEDRRSLLTWEDLRNDIWLKSTIWETNWGRGRFGEQWFFRQVFLHSKGKPRQSLTVDCEMKTHLDNRVKLAGSFPCIRTKGVSICEATLSTKDLLFFLKFSNCFQNGNEYSVHQFNSFDSVLQYQHNLVSLQACSLAVIRPKLALLSWFLTWPDAPGSPFYSPVSADP